MAKDALAHLTAHDLRTPLNTLTGLVQLFELQFGPNKSEKAREYIDYMHRAAQQMDGIIDKFLEQTDLSALPIAPQTLDLRLSINRAIDNVRVPDCPVPIEVVGPSWTVMGDPDLVHLLLSHILRNALQHPHPERPLAIRVDMTTPNRLWIADTGAGLEPEALNGVFLSVAADTKTGQRAQFGLSICREICRRHGWHIAAQSDRQNGTTIDIRFF